MTFIRKLFCSRKPRLDPDDSAYQQLDAHRLAAVCERVSGGDLEARVIGINDRDALAPLGRAINRMLDILDAYVRESSAGMEFCSRGEFHRPILLRGLAGAFRKGALVINQATLKMKVASSKIETFENERKQMVNDVRLSIGSACEELSATASEISRQAKQSTELTAAAVNEFEQANRSVQELAHASEKIKSMVKLITNLAAQTNLIALNASIEAARVGEHGRGFSIVAEEVKTLSRNTAAATGTIAGHVDAVQKCIASVQDAIGTIATSIQSLNSNAAVIDTSVGEQAQATSEISRLIADVAAAMAVYNPTAAGEPPLHEGAHPFKETESPSGSLAGLARFH